MSDLSNLSLDYLRKGQAPQANELALRAVKATPQDWHARYALGQCFQTAGQWVQAAGEYAMACKLKPQDKTLLTTLGIARQKERKFDEAIAALKEAIALDPRYDLAHNSLGLTLRLANRLDEALAAYDAGLKAIVEQAVASLRNDPNGPRFPFRLTRHGLWLDQLRTAAEIIVARDGVPAPPVLPSAAEIEQESRATSSPRTLWEDLRTPSGAPFRAFTGNFHNAMFRALADQPNYATLLRNRAAVLAAKGDRDAARAQEDEAADFS